MALTTGLLTHRLDVLQGNSRDVNAQLSMALLASHVNMATVPDQPAACRCSLVLELSSTRGVQTGVRP